MVAIVEVKNVIKRLENPFMEKKIADIKKACKLIKDILCENSFSFQFYA